VESDGVTESLGQHKRPFHNELAAPYHHGPTPCATDIDIADPGRFRIPRQSDLA